MEKKLIHNLLEPIKPIRQIKLIEQLKFIFLYLLFSISILTCLPLLGSEDFSLDGEVSLPSDIFETIEKLKENPIDINSATYDELIQIPYITPLLAMRIEDYTKQNKFYNDTKDLLLIGGLNEPLLLKISPYITIKRRKILNAYLHNSPYYLFA